MLHGVGALAMLLVAAVLGEYKPQSMTPCGWRQQHTGASAVDADT